ncbi:SDR family NAD(P)-dependent oxidoreductase [Fulvimonas soli]|uniref:3-oxoacyl-[acyl-carrier protein] reductase n=1 Tax=Fulvimonas soli TaxID=155197 RepID=A0A316IFV4_9GAMM|nr:SDR family oxidoreductase [Fulvimonas soli]PWK91903.1 3-oxoacyl-[acyl-carrier protein] reductase [Fulvimonas soli]TNY26030.1 hypothetical protein BV497_10775 [Fulvimonas soli]
MGRLSGRVALITGGASGIGEAACRRFLEEGAKVALVDIDEQRGPALAAELGADVLFLPGNHINRDDNARAIAAVVEHWGGLDILYCNAGRGSAGTLEETTDAAMQADLDSHVIGPMRMVQAALPALRASATRDARRSAAIVITASRSSLKARPNMLSYATAKHAELGLMRALAEDLGPMNIRVNAVCPGMVETPLSRSMAAVYRAEPDEIYRKLASETPLRRLARAVDVANAALFLASDEAAAIHGHALLVDSGVHAC